MRYRLALIALLLSVMFIPAVARAEQPATRPYYLHLNGIGGERSIDHTLVRSLRDGGFNAEFELYDWTAGQIGIEALTDVQKHKEQARIVADLIVKAHKANPNRPIWLSGHSAGAGIGCWALELLPEDVRVENWFMFAPALSPDYDLSKALKHVNSKAYVFSSTLDAAVLDAGTTLFGTVDGVKGEAAGLRGFSQPKGADAEQYKKIVPHPYRKEWARRYANIGSHICSMRAKFVREYVAVVALTGHAPEEEQAATRPAQAEAAGAGK